jgi:hypothetical protein
MIDVSETMSSIRYMMDKYRWMAAETDVAPIKEKEHSRCIPLTSEQQQSILSAKEQHPEWTYAEIGRQLGISKVPVRKVCLGIYKGVRQDI